MSTNVFNNLLLVFFGSIHVAGCKTPATKRNSSPAGIQKSCLDRCRTCPLQLKENSSPAGIQKVVGIVVGHIRWDGVAPRHLAQADTKAIVGDQLCKIRRKIGER